MSSKSRRKQARHRVNPATEWGSGTEHLSEAESDDKEREPKVKQEKQARHRVNPTTERGSGTEHLSEAESDDKEQEPEEKQTSPAPRKSVSQSRRKARIERKTRARTRSQTKAEAAKVRTGRKARSQVESKGEGEGGGEGGEGEGGEEGELGEGGEGEGGEDKGDSKAAKAVQEFHIAAFEDKNKFTEMQAQIAALPTRGEICTTTRNHPVTVTGLGRVLGSVGGGWLDDEALTILGELAQMQGSQKLIKNSAVWSTVYFVPILPFWKYALDLNQKTSDRERKRYTNRLRRDYGEEIRQADKWFTFVNEGRNHWLLIMFYKKTREAFFLDGFNTFSSSSISKEYKVAVERMWTILQTVADIPLDKQQHEIRWRAVPVTRQKNYKDCGVYAFYYSIILSLKEATDPTRIVQKYRIRDTASKIRNFRGFLTELILNLCGGSR